LGVGHRSSLSLREKARVRESKQKIFLSLPLILSFSLQEKEPIIV
jgi:hypothetical protein